MAKERAFSPYSAGLMSAHHDLRRLGIPMRQEPVLDRGRRRGVPWLSKRDGKEVEATARGWLVGLHEPLRPDVLFHKETARHRKALSSRCGIDRKRALAEADLLAGMGK